MKMERLRFVPNALTVARLLAAVPIAALLAWPAPGSRWLACALFVLACLSDGADGYLARRLDARSALGRLLDPIADKVLVSTVVVLLAASGDAPAIPAALIVLRELLVSGLRQGLARHGRSLPVSLAAKWKTGLQMIAVALLLPGAHGPVLTAGLALADVGRVAFWLAALVTVATGGHYAVLSLRRVGDDDGGLPS